MGRKKLSALFMKYGVSVVCISGCTSFINHNGDKVGVGVCCWYYGNMKDAKPNTIHFGMMNDASSSVIVSDVVESDDDADDDKDFGLVSLFNSN